MAKSALYYCCHYEYNNSSGIAKGAIVSKLDLWSQPGVEPVYESNEYLTQQLITYIGNKRALLDFIGNGLSIVQDRLGKRKLALFDVFSGSGVVARYLKQFASTLIVNDLEKYSQVINECYLANQSTLDIRMLAEVYRSVLDRIERGGLVEGFITELYSPRDLNSITPGERAFYTPRNARYLDTARQIIDRLPHDLTPFFLAPLLAEASVHANTSGVFKGFYKNSTTGIGQFGGNNRDALLRILGDIELPFPIFSNFECEYQVYRDDSNTVAQSVGEIDVAYLDPPYNQHPYGSNYFMLNLLVDYQPPGSISDVSGIPTDWRRSNYNKAQLAQSALKDLVTKLKAKFLLISFNSEGFVKREQMLALLNEIGNVQVLETKYNTFRGSRNLAGREIHVSEYLYLVEKY
jgi:adenine-specific DNA-methyltransferase